MRVQQYLSKKQHICDEVDEKGNYIGASSITFQDDNVCSIHKIVLQIARVGEDQWSFGWKVYDGNKKPLLEKPCSPSSICRGNIHALLYGVCKVLFSKINKHQTMFSKKMKNIVMDAVFECESIWQIERES